MYFAIQKSDIYLSKSFTCIPFQIGFLHKNVCYGKHHNSAFCLILCISRALNEIFCSSFTDDLKSSSDEFDRNQEDMRRLKRIRGKVTERLSPTHEKNEPDKDRKNKPSDKGHDRLNGRYQDSDRDSDDRHSHSDRDRHHPPDWEHHNSKRSPERKQNHLSKQNAVDQHSSPHSDRDRRREQSRPEYRQSPQRDPRGGGHDRRPRDDFDPRDDRHVNNYDTKSLDRRRGPRPSDPHRRGPPQNDPRTRENMDRRRAKTPTYDSRSLPPDEIRRHNPKFSHEWHDDRKDYNSKGEKGRGRYYKNHHRGPSSVHSKLKFLL